MSGTLRHISQFLVAWALAAVLAGCPSNHNVDSVVLQRDAGDFSPGQEFTVTITISAQDGDAISALGLTETAPENWAFVEAGGVAGQVPVVTPQVGDSGELGFIWLAVPEFPVTFTYTLLVPDDAGDSAGISGWVDYYEDESLLSSEEVTSTFTVAAP